MPLFQHVPFTTSDLLNWKFHYDPFSEKPQEIADLFETIVSAHNPNWLDLQQLMGTLLNPEEREKVRNAVGKIVRAEAPNSHAPLEERLAYLYPSKDPKWSPYTDMEKIQKYQTLVLRAVRMAAKPAVNMSKPSLVTQTATESPEAFYARLLEAYQMYTPIDPTLPENARMLAMAFISQSAPDIRKKLQRLEGALGKPLSELMEVARKTFVNREVVEELKKDQKMQRKAELLAAAIMGAPGGPPMGRPKDGGMTLGRNQCAICKKEGHWRGECPEKHRETGRGRRGRFANRPSRGSGRSQEGKGRSQEGSGRRFPRTPLIGLAEVDEWD